MRANLIVLLAALLAGDARADSELSVRVANQIVVGDDGYNAVSDGGPLTQAEFLYARTLVGLGRGALWIEADSLVGKTSDRAFATLASSLLVAQAAIGLRLTLPVRDWLVPHLRVDVGGLLGRLAWSAPAIGDGTSWGGAFFAQALLGVELLLPRSVLGRPGRRGFTAGFVVEGGYQYATALSLGVEPEAPEDELRMTARGPSLGALSLSGALVRAGLAFRF